MKIIKEFIDILKRNPTLAWAFGAFFLLWLWVVLK